MKALILTIAVLMSTVTASASSVNDGVGMCLTISISPTSYVAKVANDLLLSEDSALEKAIYSLPKMQELEYSAVDVELRGISLNKSNEVIIHFKDSASSAQVFVKVIVTQQCEDASLKYEMVYAL